MNSSSAVAKTDANSGVLIRKEKNEKGQQKLRIIGGKWRGRRLDFLAAEGLRPTGDRIRETLFNWVQASLPGCRCLDLFAGSGSLGLEAASRGAAEVVLVDSNPGVCKLLKSHVELLGAGEQVRVVHADAMDHLAKSPDQYDLVFLDPPFGESMLAPVLAMIQEQACMRSAGLIYIESENDWGLPSLPQNWDVRREKSAGQLTYRLLATGS